MQERETNPKAGENFREAVRAFYDLHPYPPPVDDMDDNRRRWQDENRRRAAFHPQDRAYTVPQLFDFIEDSGLRFGRWVRQAPYLPQCGDLAKTPHTTRLVNLPQREQYASVELFRGSMLRHNLIVYRDDRPSNLPQFDGVGWLSYVPICLPESISVQKRLPPGAAVVLINQSHTDPDLVLPISAAELRQVEAINGERSIVDIIHQVSLSGAGSLRQSRDLARSLFEQLWQHDQVVFDASH